MKQIQYLDINSVVLSIVASDQQTLPCLCRSRGTLIWRTSWCLQLFPVSELCNRHCSQGLNFFHELFSFFSRVQHSWFDTNWTSNLWMYCLYDDIWFTHTLLMVVVISHLVMRTVAGAKCCSHVSSLEQTPRRDRIRHPSASDGFEISFTVLIQSNLAPVWRSRLR